MKNAKELKHTVTERFAYCWGENTVIFFIALAGASVAAIVWDTALDFIRSTRRSGALSGGAANAAVVAVTVAAVVILLLVYAPFSYGVKWYRLQQVRGNSVHARSIFSCYCSRKRVAQAMKMSLAISLRRLKYTAPLAACMAAGTFIIAAVEKKSNELVYSAAAVLMLLMAGGLVCVAFALNYRYAAAPYLFVLNPDAPPSEIIARSKELAAGKSDYITEAVLSVSGWFASCVFVFPAAFAVPYIKMVYTAAVNELITQNDNAESGKKELLFGGEYMHN